MASEAPTTDDEAQYHDRVIAEILDDVDAYIAAPGPEGPWHYRSLRVVRVMNVIRVYDCDGKHAARYEVSELGTDHDGEDLRDALQRRLDGLHEETLAEL